MGMPGSILPGMPKSGDGGLRGAHLGHDQLEAARLGRGGGGNNSRQHTARHAHAHGAEESYVWQYLGRRRVGLRDCILRMTDADLTVTEECAIQSEGLHGAVHAGKLDESEARLPLRCGLAGHAWTSDLAANAEELGQLLLCDLRLHIPDVHSPCDLI